MKRFGFRVWAASGAFALVGVVGIFGLVSDFADIPGNRATTGDREGGAPTIDVQLATAVNESCTDPSIIWTDQTIPAVFDSSVLVATGSHDYWSDPFCVRMAPGSSGAFGYLEVTDFIETDPACSNGESEGGDTDCGTNEPGSGEISEFIYWAWNVGFSCDDQIAPGGGGGPALGEGSIAPGGIGIDQTPTCVKVRLFTNANSDSIQLDTAQSDTATWNWRMHASE
jgi:hypothetical protein